VLFLINRSKVRIVRKDWRKILNIGSERRTQTTSRRCGGGRRRGWGVPTRDKNISETLRSRKCLDYLNGIAARISVGTRLGHFNG
jgi:hypothetical protein